MKLRFFLLSSILCAAPVHAQKVPDFSGVYIETQQQFPSLRTKPSHPMIRQNKPSNPMVLQIGQDADLLRLTEYQNGSQAVFVYKLNGEPSTNDSPGEGQSESRVKFRDASLVITAKVNGHWAHDEVRVESLQLSPDLQTLTVQPEPEDPVQGRLRWLFGIDAYSRRTSLAAALEEAAKISPLNNCVPEPPYPAKRARDISHGVPLGEAGFEYLGWDESFSAFLSGEFFNELRLIPTRGGIEYRRNRVLVSKFSGPLNLTVVPFWAPNPQWMHLDARTLMGGSRFTDSLKGLRFHITWVGSDTHDLGEVPADLKTRPGPHGLPSDNWYEMQIPAQDVPISDTLEIHILSAAGDHLGCVCGHL